MTIVTFSEGTQISIGRNAKQNDLLWKTADEGHVWFHLYNHSSPHVILHKDIKFLNKSLIKEAALCVKKYSKLKSEKKVKVIYCRIDNLNSTKTIGMVKLTNDPHITTV